MMDLDSGLPAAIRALPTTGGHVPAYQLKAPGCEVLFVVALAGTQLPRHHHDTQNATVIVSGETVVITDGGEQRCGPGEWYETQPGEMHGIRFGADTVQIELRFDVPPRISDG
jgi:quercetin dioxygenase-like cupin family protein